jgi:hypothetical protein
MQYIFFSLKKVVQQSVPFLYVLFKTTPQNKIKPISRRNFAPYGHPGSKQLLRICFFRSKSQSKGRLKFGARRITFEQNFVALQSARLDLLENGVEGVRRVPELDEPDVAALLVLDRPLEQDAVQVAAIRVARLFWLNLPK